MRALAIPNSEKIPAPVKVRHYTTRILAWPIAARLTRLVYFFAIASLLIHFSGRNHYGFFRDELYYIACGNHLAFGYVDQPPLIAVIATVSSLVLGTTLSDYRFLPALASACFILLTGLLICELGGGRFAQVLSCVTVLLAPIYLALGSFLSMNAFEPVFGWRAHGFLSAF